MTDLYPMLIQPRYVERIWGGHSLAERLGKPAPRDQPIGESWEVYEENGVVNGVHAIGAGIVVYELQQTSDITYRIYDWNRRDAAGHTRALHVDNARQVLDYHRCTRGTVRPLHKPGAHRTMVIAGPYFCLEVIEAAAARALSTDESPVAVTALDQALVVHA